MKAASRTPWSRCWRAPSSCIASSRRPPNAKPGSIYRLNGTELASRLSFFLWSSIPDEELLAAAEQGKLSDPKVLEQQVRRMLADPRAKTLTTNFAFEWLKVRDMDALEPDPFVYPAFDAALRAAFRSEMEMFVDSVFHEDRSVVDLLSANYTFVNERLAAHYGIENVRGDQFRRVTLTDPNRFGLLGKGAVLMVTAYPNRTSPVLRGAYILENITGTPPSPPPPNVEAFKENKEGEKPKTIREIMEDAPRESHLQRLPRRDGPARILAGEFRHHRRVPVHGPLHPHQDRYQRQAGGRNGGERPQRSAQCAAEAPRAVRADVHGKNDDVCAGPRRRVLTTCPASARS